MSGRPVRRLPAGRDAARVLAHQLVELTQSEPDPELVDLLMERAVAEDWHEVRVVLGFCRVLAAALDGVTAPVMRAHCDAMHAAAVASGEDVLVAFSIAATAVQLLDAPDAEAAFEELDGEVARAVAMLDDAAQVCAGDPTAVRAVELPVAYVECGRVYSRRGLWEMEEEMYRRATAALDLPVLDLFRPVGDIARTVLLANRTESASALVCALLEVGRRGEARAVAARHHPVTPEQLAPVPSAWVSELQAVEALICAAAGRPDPALAPGDLLDVPAALAAAAGLDDGDVRPAYHAHRYLARSVRAEDAGRLDVAAALAAQALPMLEGFEPGARHLALRMAALSRGPGDPAWRWAEELARQRWKERLAVLQAARARLTAARMVRASEALSRQAYVDALTGLANRHALERHLAALRQDDERQPVGVVLLDLDQFKPINDAYGHAVGDAVLQRVGEELARGLRPGDLAVRLGGDEFLLVLSMVREAGLAARAVGVVEAVQGRRWDDVVPGLVVRVSAGWATGPARDTDLLMSQADRRLYRAKARRRAEDAVVPVVLAPGAS